MSNNIRLNHPVQNITHMMYLDSTYRASREGIGYDGRLSYPGHVGSDFYCRIGTVIKNPIDFGILEIRSVSSDVYDDKEFLPGKKGNLITATWHMSGRIENTAYNIKTFEFCHNKQSSALVEPQQIVLPGEFLAQVGCSGGANTPHLHMTMKDPLTGRYLCPFHNGFFADELDKEPDNDLNFLALINNTTVIKRETWTNCRYTIRATEFSGEEVRWTRLILCSTPAIGEGYRDITSLLSIKDGSFNVNHAGHPGVYKFFVENEKGQKSNKFEIELKN